MIVVGAYRAGGSPMHQMPAWSKVLVLLLWGIATMVFHDPITALGLCGAALLLLISVLPYPKPTIKGLALMAVVAAMAGGYQAYRGQERLGIDIAADLFGLFAVSLAVTTSTPMTDMLDLASSAARPLRRIVPPSIPGLMFAIMMRAIPQVATIMKQSREAAKARGVHRSVKALMIPTATRTVGFALDLGAALHARGVGDEAAEDLVIPRNRRAAARAANK